MAVWTFVKAVCAAAIIISSGANASANITVTDWSALPSSPILRWIPCFENYWCARLEVPLDHGDPARGTVAIAFLKLSATNVTSETRSLIVNPGGPGGSGIDVVLEQGPNLADLVAGGQHNIVGFDPRGVGRSGPDVNCWPGDAAGRAQFEALYYPVSSNSSSTALGQQFAAAGIFGDSCTPTVGGVNGSAAFVSTPAVARDMLSFIEAEQKTKPLNQTVHHLAKPKLWYYGLSYGTVLGATFAHLFPERVGRMILDGVVDAEDYYSLGWKSNLYDADRALDAFFESCFEAGDTTNTSSGCAFWAPSIQNIHSRLNTLLTNLKYNPIPIPPGPDSTCPLPMLATYSDLKQLVLQVIYTPVTGFPELAEVLAGLEKGNITAYTAAVVGGIPTSPCNYAPESSTLKTDVNTVIRCVDGLAHGPRLQTVSQFKDYVDVLTQQSEFFGEVWPNNANVATCRTLQVTLPPTGMLQESILSHRHTASPILFLTNTIDPVSPQRGAHKMSAVFRGSVVLSQHSVGHTAILSASRCLFAYIQQYLLEGRLPPTNTICQTDIKPFQSEAESGLITWN
ncbi:Alpha/Beta hydrolase protein [Aspergillus stella-maris]|uniref:Alpha/Beta hydrolase protein n=1 Tax=Aspergillus stella-maris TaxID=1810926 RepID=UPI003CCDAF35